MEILYKDLSYRVTGCVFEVFSEIGPGFDEHTYHQGLGMRFEKENLPFQSKPHITLYYRGMQIARLEPDFIADDAIIVELKALQTEFLPENYAQIISYLRATGRRLGILVNFGLLKVEFKRIPFDERPLSIAEDFEEVLPILRNGEADFWRLRDSIINVAKELRLGYHVEIYREGIKAELKLRGFMCSDEVKVPASYKGCLLNGCEIDYWLINQQTLLAILAGTKQVRAYDVMRMRSYLRNLNLRVGLVAFWGKEHLKILGVRPMI